MQVARPGNASEESAIKQQESGAAFMLRIIIEKQLP